MLEVELYFARRGGSSAARLREKVRLSGLPFGVIDGGKAEDDKAEVMRILSTGPKPLDMRTIQSRSRRSATPSTARGSGLELLVRLKIERFGSVDAARCEDPACECRAGAAAGSTATT